MAVAEVRRKREDHLLGLWGLAESPLRHLRTVAAKGEHVRDGVVSTAGAHEFLHLLGVKSSSEITPLRYALKSCCTSKSLVAIPVLMFRDEGVQDARHCS